MPNLACKYDIAADVEDGDIFELGKIPANCLVYGGWIAVDDIDTGTEIDIDVGWAAAGGSDTYTDTQTGVTYTNAAATADPDGFVNTGVLTGDGSAGSLCCGQTLRWMVLPDPLYFSRRDDGAATGQRSSRHVRRWYVWRLSHVSDALGAEHAMTKTAVELATSVLRQYRKLAADETISAADRFHRVYQAKLEDWSEGACLLDV